MNSSPAPEVPVQTGAAPAAPIVPARGGMGWAPWAGALVLALIIAGGAYYYFMTTGANSAPTAGTEAMNTASSTQNGTPSLDQLDAQLNTSDESTAGADVNTLNQSF